jgi:hypothetical protein
MAGKLSCFVLRGLGRNKESGLQTKKGDKCNFLFQLSEHIKTEAGPQLSGI